MNIEGIGAETVDLFYRMGLVGNIADLYELSEDKIRNLERLGDKSAENIVRSILASKQVSFERVLYAIGIRYVGEVTAKKLAQHFKSIDAIANASIDELVKAEEVGAKIAESIIRYFSDEKNREQVQRLKEYGLQMELKEVERSSSKLQGFSFVISGTFDIARDEIKRIIEDNGGKMVSSISGNLSYLVVGENMGPAKLEKAQKLGIKMISLSNLYELINS